MNGKQEKMTGVKGIFRRFAGWCVVCPHAMLFFISVWLWAVFSYGDVLRMAREYSFFAFDRMLMSAVWEQPYGSLWIGGRAMLCLFAYPWLGGLAFSILLTLISWMIGALLRLPARWRWIQYLPAAGYLSVVVWMGFDAFVFREPGWLMGIPLCVALILALQLAFVRSFSHRSLCWPWMCQTDESRQVRLFLQVWGLLLPLAVAVYGGIARSDVRLTARLQRLMWEQKWDEMTKEAEAWNGSSRPVAAYHALALVRNGRLLEDLFRVRYDFKPLHLISRKGQPSEGREIYEADCNFHAGLIQSAFRNDMEQMTFDGIGTARLRRMIRYAVLRGEDNLALRYLYVLSRQPFEDKFTNRYQCMVQNPELFMKDVELQSIAAMQPLEDYFESAYMKPLFIGYYLGMRQAGCQTAHDVATAASLYARMLPLFCYRAAAYAREGHFPTVVADALGMIKASDPHAVSSFGGLDLPAARYVEFARTFAGTDTMEVYHRAIENYSSYLGYYPFYYYFGLPDPSLTQTDEKEEKGGVN